MNKEPYKKKNSCQGAEKINTHSASFEGVHREVSDNQQNQGGVRESMPRYSCISVKESDQQRFVNKMSPESLKITAGTKWSERGFIPSFKNTDDILIKAARRTYKTRGTNHR